MIISEHVKGKTFLKNNEKLRYQRKSKPHIEKRIYNQRSTGIDDPTRSFLGNNLEFSDLESSLNKRSISFPFLQNANFYKNSNLEEIYRPEASKKYFNLTTRVIENNFDIKKFKNEIEKMKEENFISNSNRKSIFDYPKNVFQLKRLSNQILNSPIPGKFQFKVF